jgi:hypothetical protein
MAFCLDANVFIEAHRVRYPMELAPGFWDALLAAAAAGKVFSIEEVYAELESNDDDLSAWVIMHRAAVFHRNDDAATQQALGDVYAVMEARRPPYRREAKEKFLSGADPWLIAHCLVHAHTLVTEEVGNPNELKKVRIPDIAGPLGVKVVPMLSMLLALKVRLVSG